MRKIIFFLILFFSKELPAQTKADACTTLSKINALVKEFHYKPKPINDSLSVYVYNHFLKALDERNVLFLESEINSLKKHKYKLDDYSNTLNCRFLNEFYTTYQKAVSRQTAIIESIKKEKFSLSSTEMMSSSKKVMPYLKTEEELKKYYKKRLLFDVLNEIAQSSSNKNSLISVFSSISETSKQKIFDDYTCEANEFDLTTEAFYDLYFNVYCSYFDPHTEFFSTNEKSNFLSSISSDNYTLGIGLSIKEKNNR